MSTLVNQIKEHFLEGRGLTVVECLNLYRTIELRKIVSTLRREGLDIKDEWITNSNTNKRFKRYFLMRSASEKNSTQNKMLFHNEEPTFQENTSRISMDEKAVVDSKPTPNSWYKEQEESCLKRIQEENRKIEDAFWKEYSKRGRMLIHDGKLTWIPKQ